MQRLCPDKPPFALLLDFDGTLVDLAPTPDGVQVSDELVALLQSLRSHLQGALACVSGRSHADLQTWLGNTGIDLIGSHGAEANGPSKPGTDWQQWADAARQDLQAWPGVLMESKPQGMALHWRQNPQAQAAVQNWVAHHLHHWPAHRLQAGHCVLEILPQAANKGQALKLQMQRPAYQGRLPLYIGDDVTDRSAMEAARALGGYAIAVGPTVADAAHLEMDSPTTVRRYLSRLDVMFRTRKDITLQVALHVAQQLHEPSCTNQ